MEDGRLGTEKGLRALVGCAHQRVEITYLDTRLKLIYAIAGESDPSHSVPDQIPANQEV